MLGHIYSLIDLFFDSIFPSLKEKKCQFYANLLYKYLHVNNTLH